jgi:hypothetical protein
VSHTARREIYYAHLMAFYEEKNLPIYPRPLYKMVTLKALSFRKKQKCAREYFFMSAIASLRFEGKTFATANPQLFQEMLLHNSKSAIATLSTVCKFKSTTS